MPRLNPISPENATPHVRELYDAIKAKLGRVPNMFQTLAHSPAALNGYLSFSAALGGGSLSPRLREQIALLTADSNACEYCLAAHGTLGKMAGLSAVEIAASRSGEASDPAERAALHFARAVLERRGGVDDKAVQDVRAAGFSDGQIAEIIAFVALNVLTNYFNIVAQVDVDFPRVQKPGAA